jgi:hypothetical protein
LELTQLLPEHLDKAILGAHLQLPEVTSTQQVGAAGRVPQVLQV